MVDYLLTSVMLSLFTIIALAEVTGAVLCLVYRRLSSWMNLVILGFLFHASVSFATAFAPVLLHLFNLYQTTPYLVFSLITTILALLGYLPLVGGLAMVFVDVERQLRQSRTVKHAIPVPILAPETPNPWQPRTEGSREIQQ